jgi:hypothetical protein
MDERHKTRIKGERIVRLRGLGPKKSDRLFLNEVVLYSRIVISCACSVSECWRRCAQQDKLEDRKMLRLSGHEGIVSVILGTEP